MIYNEIRRGNQDKLNGLWNLSCSSAILDPEILSYLIAHGFYINQSENFCGQDMYEGRFPGDFERKYGWMAKVHAPFGQNPA